MLRHIIFGAMLAGGVPLGAQAVVLGNAQSQQLVQQGITLLSSGQMKEARGKFEQASEADPAASNPVSALSLLYYVVSNEKSLTAEQHKDARSASQGLAARAIALDANDTLAQEVMRKLTGGAAPSVYQPQGKAGELVLQGELLFSKKDFKGASEKYEQAVAIDPNYADAWLYAGDCYFAMKQWAEAEARFRKAAQIAPLHEQAWRFLSDALYEQQKWPEMEQALASAIGAHPDQVTAWQRMAQFQSGHGIALNSLGLKVKARGRIDPKTGGVKVDMQPKEPDAKEASRVDVGFWMMLALSQAAGELKAQKKEGNTTPFALELAAWQAAFDGVARMEAKESVQLQDTALLTLRKLADAGQLEAALLLLQYKDDYRPELEAWKTAHPEGVRKFINVYHLMP